MVNIRNQNDIMTDAIALGPQGCFVQMKSSTSYNETGLPPPPAGWGRVIGFTDSVDNDDEGPESRDEL